LSGIIPKGSQAGLQTKDLGETTAENIDGNQGRAQIYRTHYRWDMGLTVRDWRYVVRIPNIDRTLLTKDYSTGADLADLLSQAIELIPNMGMGQPVIYVNRAIRSIFRRQLVNKIKTSVLTMEQVGGQHWMSFDGIPVRRVDALNVDEARVV
jgi:hypothetical protein